MTQNGKGSRPRPKSVDSKTWAKNYEQIFKKCANEIKRKK